MNKITNILNNEMFIYFLKTIFMIIYTYYIGFKIINKDFRNSLYLMIVPIVVMALIMALIKYYMNSIYNIIFLDIILAVFFSKQLKKELIYSIFIITISLSVNYIFWFASIALTFIPIKIMKIQNNFINLNVILIVYFFLLYFFTKMKKFKSGIVFLKNNMQDEFFNILILNLSIIILFVSIIISNSATEFTINLIFSLITSSIIMFITIRKSLQLYYKQKMLVQDLKETKQELENKKQEIEQLEKENLNFSKTSHSIAHKQKALEYKLNELILKNEIASEIDIKDRIEKISDDIKNRPISVELAKTGIPEIDDMLKYMQSECIKNKIDFQLQLSGNIYHMINNYIEKENLEILLADMIKNAIIAINYSDNINKSILVRLGEIDNIYALYVYDSGIEFKIETFKNMGIKPCTTHADNGGTGMGLMNTFDTLKKYKASIIINEYNEPCKDNFTKVIIIKFDNKEETKICSYRYKEIEKEVKSENFKIEKIQKSIDIN